MSMHAQFVDRFNVQNSIVRGDAPKIKRLLLCKQNWTSTLSLLGD